MTITDLMKELESLGTEQNRKIYQRHGAGSILFGVSFANIDKLAKRIKCDQSLAEQLWQTGNADAQTLATRIADPAAFTEMMLEQWLAVCKYHGLVDQFVSNIVAKTPFAEKLQLDWYTSEDEWKGRAGWLLVGLNAMEGASQPNEYYLEVLAEIERTIHQEPNRKREAMYNTLLGIGIRSEDLSQAAIATAKRIGKVAIDHGDTSCKTPDAVAYIQKAREHYAAKGVPKKRSVC
ncbi:MAG: DNA alkylation repair protein [bacterium]|nr:DNA alkylation repair protein [bacterium]